MQNGSGYPNGGGGIADRQVRGPTQVFVRDPPSWSSDATSVPAGALHSSVDSFRNSRSLKFTQRGQDVKLELSGCGAEINSLIQRHEGYVE